MFYDCSAKSDTAAKRMSKTAHDYASKHRTSDVLNGENVNVDFASLLLSSKVLKGLSLAGFERPSPIQLKAIPLGRCGLDLIVQAKAGTGKTCVFSVVILESLDLNCVNVQALVLTPTREIAIQVQGVIQAIGGCMNGLRCHTFIGGTLFGPDRQKLKKCHVAVGTPGRVKQLIEYDVMPTDSIRLFVLDEADKLLDEKFQDQINWIYNRLPVSKQMLALSATYPEALAKSLTAYMRDPTFVRLNPRNLALKGIKQFYKVVPGHGMYHKAFEIKVDHLLQLFTQVSFSQCLVFSNLSSRAQNLSDILCENGWPSTCISGNQDQIQRLNAMSMLKTFQCRVLISTDLTARGIDAENVNLIVNLDVPSDGKTYLHRIGRAGRFGSKGVAVTLASEGNEELLLRNIQRQCHVKLQVLPDPVPSDLVNSVDVGVNASGVTAKGDSSSIGNWNAMEEITDDETSEGTEMNIANAEINKNQTSKMHVENAPSCVEARVDSDESSLQTNPGAGTCPSPRVNYRLESAFKLSYRTPLSGLNKSCQTDTHSLPFNIRSPINFKIPSLAQKVQPRRQEDRWTWQKAESDFEKFINGCTECCDDTLHLQREKNVERETGDQNGDANTEYLQTVHKSSVSDQDVSLTWTSVESVDNSRRVQTMKDAGSLLNAEQHQEALKYNDTMNTMASQNKTSSYDQCKSGVHKGDEFKESGELLIANIDAKTGKGRISNASSICRRNIEEGNCDISFTATSKIDDGINVDENEPEEKMPAKASSHDSFVTEEETPFASSLATSKFDDNVNITFQESEEKDADWESVKENTFVASLATSEVLDDVDDALQEKKVSSPDYCLITKDGATAASFIVSSEKEVGITDEDENNTSRASFNRNLAFAGETSVVSLMSTSRMEDKAVIADQETCKGGTILNEKGRLSEAIGRFEDKEKVSFSWRPSQDFFSNFITEDTGSVSLTDGISSEYEEEAVGSDEQDHGKGIKTEVHDALTDDTDNETPNRSAMENHTPETVLSVLRCKPVTNSNQVDTATSTNAVGNHMDEKATSKRKNLYSQASMRSFNGRSDRPVGSYGKPDKMTSNVSKDLLHISSMISTDKSPAEKTLLGADPIWQSYTGYLIPEGVSDDSECSSAESDSDDATGSPKSQDLSVDGLPSQGGATCKARQNRHPDCRYDTATDHGSTYWGWLPTPSERHSSTGGVSDYTPFTTVVPVNEHNQGVLSRFELEDYYQGAYGGWYNAHNAQSYY